MHPLLHSESGNIKKYMKTWNFIDFRFIHDLFAENLSTIGHLTEHSIRPQYTNSYISKCTTKITCESTEKQSKCCKYNYCITGLRPVQRSRSFLY